MKIGSYRALPPPAALVALKGMSVDPRAGRTYLYFLLECTPAVPLSSSCFLYHLPLSMIVCLILLLLYFSHPRASLWVESAVCGCSWGQVPLLTASHSPTPFPFNLPLRSLLSPPPMLHHPVPNFLIADYSSRSLLLPLPCLTCPFNLPLIFLHLICSFVSLLFSHCSSSRLADMVMSPAEYLAHKVLLDHTLFKQTHIFS